MPNQTYERRHPVDRLQVKWEEPSVPMEQKADEAYQEVEQMDLGPMHISVLKRERGWRGSHRSERQHGDWPVECLE